MTVPVTDEAADETVVATDDPNHTATAAAAASHNVFLVARLLSPMLIAELLSVGLVESSYHVSADEDKGGGVATTRAAVRHYPLSMARGLDPSVC
jgi:hypothetical protein